MKVDTILEARTFDNTGRMIQDDIGTKTAESLAKQFLDVAGGNTQDTYASTVLAKKLAGALYQQILNAIDEEVKVRQGIRVAPGIGFRAKA